MVFARAATVLLLTFGPFAPFNAPNELPPVGTSVELADRLGECELRPIPATVRLPRGAHRSGRYFVCSEGPNGGCTIGLVFAHQPGHPRTADYAVVANVRNVHVRIDDSAAVPCARVVVTVWDLCQKEEIIIRISSSDYRRARHLPPPSVPPSDA